MNEKVVGKTKHGELTIDQLAEIQPGMARLMDEIAKRFWYMYYAAKGGNWQLAGHNLNQARALMNVGSITRPKFANDLAEFIKQYLEPVLESIVRKDWQAFEQAYNKCVVASDRYHDKYGYEYIRFTLPSTPPEHIDLRPPEQLRKTQQD